MEYFFPLKFWTYIGIIINLYSLSQVFQRRKDGSVDFYLGWQAYKNGFGNVGGEFWMGNEHLHRITTQVRYELRVDLQDVDGVWRYAYYDNFEIKSESENFKLIVGAYEGTAGKCTFVIAQYVAKPQ